MSVGEKSLADRVKVDKGFFTIFELKRRYDNTPKRVILDSNFQRDDVWSHVRQAELIESILMGLPLPIFYLNQDRYGRLVVVDGRQRLTAMFKYMNNEYALQKLKIMSELNGKHFDELEPVQRAQIEDFQLQAHIILPATPENIKYDIFDRVNRGGVQLNHQEIRNAMYGGKSTELLQKVAESECFRMHEGQVFCITCVGDVSLCFGKSCKC